MRRGSRVALRVETCLHESFGKAAEKKGLSFGDGIRVAMLNYVRKITPSVVGKVEKGIEAAVELNEKRGRKEGSRILDGKVVGPKEARKLAKSGKLKDKSSKKVVKISKGKTKKTAKIAALKSGKKKVSLL